MDQNKLQELQILEQNLQSVLMQKQTFQIELAESQGALEELEKSGEDVYKIIGQLMIKTEKEKMKSELEEKKKMLELRLKTFENQEKSSTERLEELRKEFLKEQGK
jgi:prefoldin beta subunit